MAHPRSEDKRMAILDAAAELVAVLGLEAPTAKISRGAGVAEGTLFSYFANKDELLNHLFLHIKMDIRDALMTGYPAGKKLIERSRHVWNRYIAWGTANPQKRKAVRQLAVSDRITEETRGSVANAYEAFDEMMCELATGGALKDRPPAFTSAVLGSLAETTMEFIAREPDQASCYTEAGFEAFWRAVAS